MDDILYGTFFLAQFGVPIAALVFIVYCIVKGEISKGYLKAAGFGVYSLGAIRLEAAE